MRTRTNTLLIRTPEGIVFSQVLASPVTRFLAWGLDLVCIIAALSLLNTGLTLLRWLAPDLAQALALVLYFVISIGYAMATEWYWRGQTLGKRLLRLRVVDAQGFRLRFSQIALRNLLRAIDAMPVFYLVGGTACLLSRRAQRLGDVAAGTIVVRVPRLEQPDLQQVMAGKYNSLREHPHLEARLRQRVSPAEAAVALAAVLRSEGLEAPARLELFQELASHFRDKVEFPRQAVEGLSDEQYVRNVVDVLYRVRRPAPGPPAEQPAPAG